MQDRLSDSFDQLKRRLKTRPNLATPPETAPAESLRFALALRGRSEPLSLLPENVDSTEKRLATLDTVAADCDIGTGNNRQWLLQDSVRRRVLLSRSPDAVADALKSIPEATADAVTEALRVLYMPQQTDLDSLGSAQLRML